MTEREKKVIRWLGRVKGIDEEIDALIKEQNKAFLSATAAVQRPSPVKVQTSRMNSSENRMAQYAAYSEEIDKRIEELYQVKCEVKRAIRSLSSATERTVLLLRYIHFFSYSRIAQMIHYSQKQVERIHRRALGKILITDEARTVVLDTDNV